MDAAPFRAHVRHIVAACGVPWPAMAVAAGVPLAAVQALLTGRAGRPLTRIEPRLASRLLAVDAVALAAMRSVRVPAALTTDRLRDLLAGGDDPLWLARWCRIDAAEVALLIDGDAPTCTRLTETLVLAARRLRQASPQPADTAA